MPSSQRVDRLVLFCPYPRGVACEDDRLRALERIRDERDRWGERDYLEEIGRQLNPQWADDAEYLTRSSGITG